MNFQSYLWFIVETGSKTMSRGISDRTGFIELHNVLKHAELAVCRWRHRLKKRVSKQYSYLCINRTTYE